MVAWSIAAKYSTNNMQSFQKKIVVSHLLTRCHDAKNRDASNRLSIASYESDCLCTIVLVFHILVAKRVISDFFERNTGHMKTKKQKGIVPAYLSTYCANYRFVCATSAICIGWIHSGIVPRQTRPPSLPSNRPPLLPQARRRRISFPLLTTNNQPPLPSLSRDHMHRYTLYRPLIFLLQLDFEK